MVSQECADFLFKFLHDYLSSYLLRGGAELMKIYE